MTNTRALDAAVRRFHRLVRLCAERGDIGRLLVAREYRDAIIAEYRHILKREARP